MVVMNIAADSASSSPAGLTAIGNKLFFSAGTASYGRELYMISLDSAPSSVVGSHVYHKGSSFAGMGVEHALDSGKQLAKEGAAPQELGYENLINTSRGINGLAFDFDNLPGNLTADDFEFQMSPTGAFIEADHPPSGWDLAPAPSSISLVPGAPARVIIEWPDNAIANRWLRVTIKANGNTGLLESEVYYLGHLLGEMNGPQAGIYSISNADVSMIRGLVDQNATISTTADIDKNSFVNNSDISLMRSGVGVLQLRNITIPAASGNLMLLMKVSDKGQDSDHANRLLDSAAPAVELKGLFCPAEPLSPIDDEAPLSRKPLSLTQSPTDLGSPSYSGAVDWLLGSSQWANGHEQVEDNPLLDGGLEFDSFDQVFGQFQL